MTDVAERMQLARALMTDVGQLTMKYFRGDVAVERKADQTPVTIADREAEQYLRTELGRRFPQDGFLGEEFGDQPGPSGFKWIIDPIDATKNFVRGIPLFANLLGLEHAGKMVGGVAVAPGVGEHYHAITGQGAYCNDRRIVASDIQSLAEAQVVYSSISWFDKTGTTATFLDLIRQAGRTRGFGDYIGFLLVASGSAELMLEPQIAPWDIAALKPIVEEAGGVMTDWFGNDTIYGQGCIAGNPAIHRLALQHIHRSAAC